MNKIYILFLPFILFAHPHTFMDIYPTISKNKLTIEWVFDEMTSSMLIMDFDLNHDGKFSKSESDDVFKEAFVHLKANSYYTYMYKNKKKINISKTIRFKSEIHGQKVSYIFDVYLDKAVKRIDFYDPDLYIACMLKDSFVKKHNKKLKYKIKEINNDYYFGYSLEFK